MARVLHLTVPVLLVPMLLGLVGNGPLSLSSVNQADTTVTYQRFARRGAPWTMTVQASPPSDGPLEVAISREFHDAIRVESITPQPTEVTAQGQQVLYTFVVDHRAASVQIAFHVQGDAMGSQHADIRVGEDRVAFDQFLYP